MKKIIFFMLFMIYSVSNSQELNNSSFDFWLGTWEATWESSEGTTITGTNTISKVLDGNVIKEEFEDPSTKFNGLSLSIYNTLTNEWNQTWVDNQGAHYLFTGTLENGNPVFKTKITEKDGVKIGRKMVFKNISKDAFSWEWLGTKNNGNHWDVLWKISYVRKQV
ncbi:MAG: hypothetical protein KUG68_07160 [Flavobacteriaceae bacterium]|nr:hypothetical protein [Flavobacteriaceae bacterium]